MHFTRYNRWIEIVTPPPPRLQLFQTAKIVLVRYICRNFNFKFCPFVHVLLKECHVFCYTVWSVSLLVVSPTFFPLNLKCRLSKHRRIVGLYGWLSFMCRKWASGSCVTWPQSSQTYTLPRLSLYPYRNSTPWILRQWDSSEHLWVNALSHISHL